MQTKTRIQQLISSAGTAPNRRLGQHFLVDLNLMKLLVDAAGIGPSDIVLEVGCGTGSLTEALADRAGLVVAVEIDAALARIAAGVLADRSNIHLICDDVLKTKHVMNQMVIEALSDARRTTEGRLLLVSNLPYNVAAPVMMNLLESPIVADAMYVTVQREVAERMTAAVGDRHYGPMSVMLSAAGRTSILRTLKPSVFWPEPAVHSAMVSFVRILQQADRIGDFSALAATVRLFMGHRRKTLGACVKLAEADRQVDWLQIMDACGADPAARAQEIDPATYVRMANAAAGVRGIKYTA